ncbi:MAG: amidase [Acidimicrobiales bacterium]|nr:amidase [Acidimicrobiales bacterium]
MTDLASLDATAQAELIRTGEMSATEAVQAAIDRCEAVNGELNAVIIPRFERALTEADGPLGDGPFAGVPFLLKDLDGTMANEPLHAGTRFLKDHGYVAPQSSELISRFLDAGLVVIGRTNTPELGLVTTAEPETYGPSHNPWDTTRSTGGSSGGSAAAVAAGVVPMAHAGDGGGSIRIPASECGLFGLKPSRGRITTGPEVGEAWAGLVARLAVTRSVRDAAALLDAVSGPGVGDPYWAPPPERPYSEEITSDPGSLRIGFVVDPPDGASSTDPEVADAVRATAALLESLGHRVEESFPEALADPSSLGHFLVAFGAWTARELDRLGEMVGTPVTADDVEAGTWAVAESGRSVSAADYLAALDGLHALTRRVVSWWAGGFDLLLTPTITELPPTLGQFAATPDNPMAALFRSSPFAAFTAPFNTTGQPAMSVPLHQSSAGLPIGMQFVAAPGREDVLFRLAGQLESAVPWADRRPPVWSGV